MEELLLTVDQKYITVDKIAKAILADISRNSSLVLPELILDNLRNDEGLNAFADKHTIRLGDIKVLVTPFIEDCIRVRYPAIIQGYYIEDLVMRGSELMKEYDARVNYLRRATGKDIAYFKDMAHRDAIQLIPPNRYLGGVLNNVCVIGNVIVSDSHIQPIFSSDGGYNNLRICDNIVGTNSQHKISISGCFSGEMIGNKDPNGDEVIPDNYPLRIGGGNLNYHIVSFRKGAKTQYRPIIGVTGTLHDMRHIPRRGLNISNFDLEAFELELAKITWLPDRFDKAEFAIRRMKARGDIKVEEIK